MSGGIDVAVSAAEHDGRRSIGVDEHLEGQQAPASCMGQSTGGTERSGSG